MKSKKADTFLDLDDKNTKMAAQLGKSPMKKKPKIMFTFSSFARCTALSLPKFDVSSPSSRVFDGGNANSHNRYPKIIEEIESSSDDDYQDDEEEEDQEVLFSTFANSFQLQSWSNRLNFV